MTIHSSVLKAIAVLSFGFGTYSATGMASSSQCTWQGASVFEGKWLECKNCKWRYCQCQPGSKWGNCTNEEPNQGACDWSNPDWTDPACQNDGTKPCDWTHPDWNNPACNTGGNNPPCDWTKPDWSNPNCG